MIAAGVAHPGNLTNDDREHPMRPSADLPPQYDGLIVDLDGVVWLGGQLIDGVADAIARLRASGVQLLFLTNDPQSSRPVHAARLTAGGIPASVADVLTSAAATARFLTSRRGLPNSRPLVIGSRAVHQEILDAGLNPLMHAEAAQADIVVVGGHDGFDYAELCAATTAIMNGAKLYATGRDRVFPTAAGPQPATGAILAAIETATRTTATVLGKPEPYIFEIARESLAGCAHVAVIGDDLHSDIAGAKRSGLDAIVVLTGNTNERDLAHAPVQPDLVLASLADLPAVSMSSVRGPATNADPRRRA